MAEYLIAMKLMSGRQYKNGLSDIAGILWEHQKCGSPIMRESVDNAAFVLYGENAELPASKQALDAAFAELTAGIPVLGGAFGIIFSAEQKMLS